MASHTIVRAMGLVYVKPPTAICLAYVVRVIMEKPHEPRLHLFIVC